MKILLFDYAETAVTIDSLSTAVKEVGFTTSNLWILIAAALVFIMH